MSAITMTDRRSNTGTRATDAFAGTVALVRLMLRRDRVRLPVWLVAIVATLLGIAHSYAETFPTAQDLQARAELVDNPVFIAFNGPGYGLNDYTLGVMVANESLYLGVILVALMSILLTVRHTRTEEESGRSELVRAAAVGRHAGTAAALIVVSAAAVAAGGLTAVGLATSLDELDWTGSLAYGLSMAAAGLVFAVVALLAVQVTEYGRGAVGLGVSALAVSYLVRAVGDVTETGLSWLSPFGWSLATRAFVDERWWPLLLSVALATLLTATAMTLSTRRDVGAGFVPPRPGAAVASSLLVHPVGFAARLQRGVLAAWATGLLLTGLTFGPLAGEIESFAADNEQIQQILAAAEGGTLLESWLGMITLMLAMLATGCALQLAFRLRGEESDGRAEALLATGLSRTRWAGGYLVVALVGSGLAMLAGSVGLGITAAANQRDAGLAVDLVIAGLAYLPAVWVVVGVVIAAFGVAPRAVAVGWLVLAYSVFVGLLGGVLDLPDVVRDLSPFSHVPQLPADAFAASPLAILLMLAATLIAVGLVGLRRRDVEMN